MSSQRLCFALVALWLVACQATPAQPTTPATKPNLDGFVVLARGPGARYVIDTRGQVCLLVIDHAITTRVRCAALQQNVKGAAEALSWLHVPARERRPFFRPTPASDSQRAGFAAAMDAGITRTGPKTVSIRQQLLNELMTHPARMGRGARIVPSVKDGKPNGLKLYAIRPSSFYARIGLMNGDTIHDINGFSLSGPGVLFKVYAKLKTATLFSLQVTRRQAPVTLTIKVVP